MNQFFGDSETVKKLRRGALRDYLDVYAAALDEQGYAQHTGQIQLRILSNFSQWLERKGFGAPQVSPAVWTSYLRDRHRQYKRRRDDNATGQRLIQLLRPALKTLPAITAREHVAQEFGRYLGQERGLSAASLSNYLPVVRSFLTERFRNGVINWKALRASDITGFVQRHATATVLAAHSSWSRRCVLSSDICGQEV